MCFLKRLPIRSFLMLTLLMLPEKGTSDLIFLKDGTQVEAQKVWEDNGLVRFSLPNYDGIVITYSKEIVERIERGHKGVDSNQKAVNDKERARFEGSAEASPGNNNNLTVPTTEQSRSGVSSDGAGPSNNPSVASAYTEIDMSLVESVTGIQFYNARRTFKYQTGPDAKFHTFNEAIDDLAAKFDKDPYWIGRNLGNTNDLGQIYINVNRTEEQTEVETEDTEDTARILFYDPRRTFKYWVAVDTKYRTLDEAVNSLAQQYARSPEWVIDHLGETNDLTEIHHNLQKEISADDVP